MTRPEVRPEALADVTEVDADAGTRSVHIDLTRLAIQLVGSDGLAVLGENSQPSRLHLRARHWAGVADVDLRRLAKPRVACLRTATGPTTTQTLEKLRLAFRDDHRIACGGGLVDGVDDSQRPGGGRRGHQRRPRVTNRFQEI
jgi:hypothetical protein